MWKKLGIILLWFFGLLGPVLLFTTQVKVEEATSNIAGWARFIGFDEVSAWVGSPNADGFLAIAGLASILLALSSYFGLILPARKRALAAARASAQLDLGYDFVRMTDDIRRCRAPLGGDPVSTMRRAVPVLLKAQRLGLPVPAALGNDALKAAERLEPYFGNTANLLISGLWDDAVAQADTIVKTLPPPPQARRPELFE